MTASIFVFGSNLGGYHALSIIQSFKREDWLLLASLFVTVCCVPFYAVIGGGL